MEYLRESLKGVSRVGAKTLGHLGPGGEVPAAVRGFFFQSRSRGGEGGNDQPKWENGKRSGKGKDAEGKFL